jgi:hypothetical protein
MVPLKNEIRNLGELNYVITQLILSMKPKTYTEYNALVGVLECVKQEFYRRAVSEYENKAIERNGDVF